MKEPCRIESHGPTCEGGGLHIRSRHKNGCAQFQDGSWMPVLTCWEDHGDKRSGQAGQLRRRLDEAFDRNREVGR